MAGMSQQPFTVEDLYLHQKVTELDGTPEGFGFDVRRGQYVTFSVRDTGRGMDAETLTHIFEPFQVVLWCERGVGAPTAEIVCQV